jgi:tetratricopeptide (TPR) repeat protein
MKPRALAATWSVALALFGTACPRGPVEDPEPEPQTKPPVAGDPVERAGKLMEQGDMRGAESVIDEALGQHKDNHELWFAKGVVRQAQNDDDGATLAWTKALELQPEFVPAIFGIGAVFLARGEFDNAIDRFTQALRIEPNFADAHYNIGLALLGTGARPKAIEAFERAVKLAPDDPTMLVQLADMYVIDEKLDAAIPLVTRASEVAPKDPTAFVVWGNALVKKGDFAGAIARYATALQNDPNGLDARLGLARAQQRAGKLADAAKQLELLTQVVPDSAVVWAEWGTVLAKSGDLTGALAKLDKAIAIDPKFEAAYVRKIAALTEAKRCKEARVAAQTLRDLEPADESLEAGLAALGRCKK